MLTSYRYRADLLKAMAHPLRLQVLDVLRQGPECVCHLSAALSKPQPYISQQLAILRNSGVILDEREGANVFYRLANADIARQVEAALGPSLSDEVTGRRVVVGCPCPKCNQPCPDEMVCDAAERVGAPGDLSAEGATA